LGFEIEVWLIPFGIMYFKSQLERCISVKIFITLKS
jgi:hypothetical protein